jgi:hypothetical protein
LCLNAVIHLAFALAVWIDAARMGPSRRSTLVGPFVWFLATLLGGPLTAGLYWVMHHSTIAPVVDSQAKTDVSDGAKDH